MRRVLAVWIVAGMVLAACGSAVPELTSEQIAYLQKKDQNSLVAKTVDKPGSSEPYAKGKPGGTWTTDITDDPKSFNLLHDQDTETSAVVGGLYDYLLNYDVYTKQWKPELASYKVKVDEKAGTMAVIFTLRDDLYWTTLADPGKRVKVTSDDVVYWYNDILGDPALQQSEYSSQFLQMPDGSKKRIEIKKIDDRTFELLYPRIVAEPEEAANMRFGPRYIFDPLKRAKGADGVLNLWSVDTDPKTIPAVGPYYIESYHPGVDVVLVRNPNYWKRDDYGQPVPYINRIDIKVVPNRETEKLKFLAGELDNFTLRPEDLDEMVAKNSKDYTVYYAGPSLGAAFIAWNENPKNLAPKYIRWFTNTKFRQAMSCFFDRTRIVNEVYRGLAEPALYAFNRANPFFDASIKEQYTYDPERGRKLFAEIGIRPNKDGLMQDSHGEIIAYDLDVPAENNVANDVANVFADEMKRVGITIRVHAVPFQTMVDGLMKTYDWQSLIIGLTSSIFPIDGGNVWLSSGNLHLWRPLQSQPATPWEARIDDLYWQGFSELDPVKAKAIWDQYQRIILDQLPLMYIVYPDSFVAYRNSWGNLRVDTLGAPDMNYVYAKE